MYSKYDDPDFVPAPGERDRDRLRDLRALEAALVRELEHLREEIAETESRPYVLDTPLPV